MLSQSPRTAMLKLTQSHLVMNNIFPPINGHSRPPSEDLHGLTTTGSVDMHSTSKPTQLRRQPHIIEPHRRTPLRSTSMLPTPATRYVTAAAAAAAAVASPSISGSPLLRSPSFVQTGASTQFEPAKIIYRSSDFAWNDHPNNNNLSHQTLRAPSPAKNKLSTSARPLANGTLHESTAATLGNSTIQPAASSAQNLRDDMNNGDLLMAATAKARHAARLQRTNSQFDKTVGPTGHGLPLRSESYRSSRLDYSMRPRNTSSKQRNYISSKTSFYDINGGEFYLNGGQDENLYYHQQQINALNSSQRLNSSTFDLNTSRKPFAAHKSNSFNVAANTHAYHQSTQDLHRSDTNIDRNNQNRFTGRGTNSKEQIVSAPKQRLISNGPGERHSSAQSYPSRDPNDSYAYNNVKKYIEENDLMSPEKEQIIRNWVLDVEKYRHQLQKFD